MIHIPFILSLLFLVSAWFWFAMYWNFLIMGDGDMGTKKQLLWTAIALFVGVIQFTVVVILYKPIYGA